MAALGSFNTDPSEFANSPFKASMTPAIPSPASIRVSPRSQINATPNIPGVPASPAFNPSTNANDLLNANRNLQAYRSNLADQWYNEQQRSMVTPTQIPGVPTNPTQLSSLVSPSPVGQIPGVTPGTLRMTREDGSTVSAPTGILPGAPVQANPAYGQLNPYQQQQVNVSNPGAYGTLRGSFQAHDAQGNAIPGAYNMADASAPRDLSNLQGIAKSNAVNSPAAQSYLADQAQTNPGYKAAIQQKQDVESANAAKMPVSLYQQYQSMLKNPEQQDIASLSPKDRLQYQRQQKVDAQNADIQNRKMELQRNKQINDTLGGVGKFVVSGLKEVSNWFKEGANKVKTDEQKREFDQNFRLKAEEAWARTASNISKGFKNPDAPTNDEKQSLTAARNEFMKHVYGEQTAIPEGTMDNGDGTITYNGTVYRRKQTQ